MIMRFSTLPSVSPQTFKDFLIRYPCGLSKASINQTEVQFYCIAMTYHWMSFKVLSELTALTPCWLDLGLSGPRWCNSEVRGPSPCSRANSSLLFIQPASKCSFLSWCFLHRPLTSRLRNLKSNFRVSAILLNFLNYFSRNFHYGPNWHALHLTGTCQACN